MTIGIIGLGLIGGSMALDLKRRGFASRVLGVESDPFHAEAALRMGLCDELVSYEDCVDRSDLTVVAVPVGTAVKTVVDILDRFQAADARDKVVIDVCSTKEQINLSTQYHPRRPQYVSTHPMAGTEYSGPWAAMPGLFLWGRVAPDNPYAALTPADGKSLGERVSDTVLYRSGVFITPGFIFGSNGKRYIRISLCAKEEKLKEALERIETLNIMNRS